MSNTYRITIYDNPSNKFIEETTDEDTMRETVDEALNDIESRQIKTFTVSWISDKQAKKEWWDK